MMMTNQARVISLKGIGRPRIMVILFALISPSLGAQIHFNSTEGIRINSALRGFQRESSVSGKIRRLCEHRHNHRGPRNSFIRI